LEGVKAKQVACGGYHMAVLLENGKVMLLGNNEFGQCDDLKVEGVKAK